MPARHTDLMRHEIVELLATHSIGRLCYLDGGFPLALPVNYRFQRDGPRELIVLQTSASSRLAQSTGLAGFELDHIDVGTGDVWTVLVRGRLRRVHGAHGLPGTSPLIGTGRDQWLTIEVASVTGRRFHLDPTAPDLTDIAGHADDADDADRRA